MCAACKIEPGTGNCKNDEDVQPWALKRLNFKQLQVSRSLLSVVEESDAAVEESDAAVEESDAAGNMKESNRKELRHTFFHLFTLDVSVFPVTHDVYKRSKKHT